MKHLKLSAPDWCFFTEGCEPKTFYRNLKAMGYDGAEMVAPERQQAALNAGLEIINISGPGMQDGMNKKSNHAKLSTEILRLTEEAARNKIPYIIVFSGNTCGMSYEEGFENCRTAFSALLEKMRGSGVKLLFEMLNSFDHQDYQADSEKFGFDLAKQLNSPDFKILYDIYHMRKSGCDPFQDLNEKLPYIAHFHVADLNGRKFPRKEGAIDYKAFLDAIPDTRYHGYIGMEFLTDKSEIELDLAAKLFRGYVK